MTVCLYTDIDECNGGLGVCGPPERATRCQNSDGNFSCDCEPGFEFDGKTCAGQLRRTHSHHSTLCRCCSTQRRHLNFSTAVILVMPPPRRGGALSGHRRPSSVCLSDVAYIGSNSKTKRPRKTKLCSGVPQVTCDSHTDFKVKRSKVKVTGRGHIVAAT